MGKSKSTKDHKKRLAAFKVRRKQEQERFKKMMYNNYVRAQEEYLASQESHKETEEQEIDIDTGDFNINNIEMPEGELSDVEVPDIEFPEKQGK